MFRHAYFSSVKGSNFVFTGKRIHRKDGIRKTANRPNTRQKNTFVLVPYSGFVRRRIPYDRHETPYNYIHKSHWLGLMQFLRTH